MAKKCVDELRFVEYNTEKRAPISKRTVVIMGERKHGTMRKPNPVGL